MVLLAVLHTLAQKNRWRLIVGHLNHRLRGRSSDADERLVCRAAQSLGLRAVVESADVPGFAKSAKISMEMAGRKLRHDFLAGAAARVGARAIALAHHADDQIELFLLRLLRGSGGEGLAGMRWRSPSPSDRKVQLVRPLLDQPKSVLREYARLNGIRFREDATNACLDIARNRVRHELLPFLRTKYQPAVDRTLLRVASIIGAEADFISAWAQQWLRQTRTIRGDRPRGSPPLKGEPIPFENLHAAVQRRCLELQLREHHIAPAFDLVEQLRLTAEKKITIGRAGAPKAKPIGVPERSAVVRDKQGILHVQNAARPFSNTSELEVRLGKAGRIVFEGLNVAWKVLEGAPGRVAKSLTGREFFDAEKVGSRVLLRHWLPGDRFQPIGMPRSVKLQDFLTNRKVPQGERHRLIVATTPLGEVFWVEGQRVTERFKLTAKTIRRLHWTWRRL